MPLRSFLRPASWLRRVSCLVATACGTASAMAGGVLPAPAPSELGRFTCVADVPQQTLTCQSLAAVTTGGMVLRASAPASEEGVWTTAVAVGTSPTGGAVLGGLTVRVLGAPQTTRGTGAVRPAGPVLAAYSATLVPGGTSEAQPWRFDVEPGVEAFSVQVAVAGVATIPLAFATNAGPAAQNVGGTSETIAGAVRTATGLRLPSSTLSWSTSDAGVATVSPAGLVTRVGPGSATITLSGNGVPAAQYAVQVCPNLAVGEVHHFTDAQSASLCVSGGSTGAAEYTLIPMNLTTSTAVGTGISLTVGGSGIQAVTGPPTPAAVRADDGADLLGAASPAGEATFAASPIPAGAVPLPTRAGRQMAVPVVGDSLTIQVATGCTGTRVLRRGGVRAVSANFAIVYDGQNPAGNTMSPDSLANRLERIVWPALTTHFGTPLDRDGNGRIVVFYTGYINSLTPPATPTTTEGLFQSRDLYASTPSGCPRSNAGEYLYLSVPDPTGAINSNVRTVSSVEGGTTRLSGGLLTQMVAAQKRLFVTGNTQTEEPWLEQGLISLTEEFMFYSQSVGLAPRQNIVATNLTSGPNASRRVAAFNTYANGNFGRLRNFLQRPDTSGAFRAGTSNASRGATWAFLRYALDRRVAEGGVTEASILSPLAGGQAATGRENLRLALGLASTAVLDEWYRDFLVALYADDAVSGLLSRYTNPSWSLRSLYTALNASYQLTPRALSSGTLLTLSYVGGGGAAFLRFGVASGGFATFTAHRSGAAPSPMRLSIVRTK